MPTRVSFVIPVFNAESTIGPLCRSIVAEFSPTHEVEVILVDDGSRDGTERVCRGLQEEHLGLVTYLRLSRNFGEHSAVMAGLHYARGDYAVTLDDDLQNPPGEIRKLLAEIEKGYDAVYARYERRRDPLARRLASGLHGWLARVFLRKPDTLTLSTFRVLSRFLYREIIKYRGSMPYIDAIVLRVTANIGSVGVRHEARRAGRSNYTLPKLFALWGNAMVSYSLIPLRLIGLLGLFFVLLGAFHGGWLLFDAALPARENPTDYERLTAVITFFRGLQLVAIAIVGEYVGRNFLHLNRDPQFVIRTVRPAAGREGDGPPDPPPWP